jgi:hypothetical protein
MMQHAIEHGADRGDFAQHWSRNQRLTFLIATMLLDVTPGPSGRARRLKRQNEHRFGCISGSSPPTAHCPQITRVVWTASRRGDIRKSIFQDSLFPIQTVRTQNVALLKPVSFAL